VAVVKSRMSDLIRISLVLILILVLLRKKLNVGYVLLIASSAIFFLYGMDSGEILNTILKTITGPITIRLVLALSLIRTLELILRERNILSAMMTTAKYFLKRRKAIITSMPLLIGMLPSLGGAYFSAPMVRESTSGLSMSLEEKAFINYWFRHPWEFILPLYPGILLAAAVSGIPLYSIIKANLVYAVALLGTGFLFSMRKIEKAHSATEKPNESRKSQRVKTKEMVSFLPIISILLMVVIFQIELHIALPATILPILVFYRYKPADIIRVTRHGFGLEVLVMILGIMLFKESMEASGSVVNISEFFVHQKIPLLPILCLLPFMTGFLTGITVGFVGSTFPLLISITGGASLAHISLAFAAGFLGVLLSPVHLCLVLTKEYFKADLWGIYKKIMPAGFIIFIAALIQYMILR
jgi:uncharacterized protein